MCINIDKYDIIYSLSGEYSSYKETHDKILLLKCLEYLFNISIYLYDYWYWYFIILLKKILDF